MPNESHRLTDTTVKALNNMFFMFNSIDERIDISLHPKFHIVINNVSKYGDNYDFEKIEKDPNDVAINAAAKSMNEKRITAIKSSLCESLKNYYLSELISDTTGFGGKAWKEIKDDVCANDSFRNEIWFTELLDHEKALLYDLRQIQLDKGINVPIEP